MMKKKKKNGLLIGCLALVLLLGLYGVILAINKKEAKKETEENGSNVTLLSMNRDEITRISYTKEDETYHFQNIENNWVSEEEPEETLTQSYLINIRNLFTGTDAEAVVDTQTQNLENYGLDQPSYILTASTAEGEEQTLYVGNYNSSVDQYYAYASTVEGVYLISKKVATYLDYHLSDMISTESIPSFSAEATTLFRQTWNGETILIENKPEGSVYDASDVLIWFLMTGFSHEIGCSTTTLEDLFTNLSELSYRKTAAAGVEEADLAQFGLQEPAGSIYIEYTDSDSGEAKTFELLIGDVTEESYYYVKEAQSNKVFTMSKDTLDKILEKTKYDYVYRYPAIVNVRSVDRVIFKESGTSYELGVRTETVTEENGNPTEDFIYSYHGTELPEEMQSSASSLYSGIISLGAERVVDQPKELGNQIDFSITFERKKEPEKIEVLFYEYNSSYYLCSVNGDAIYLINMRDLEEYKNQIYAVLESFE